jgi:FMN reductase
VGISGSPSAKSRSRSLLEHALSRLGEGGVEVAVVDLSELDADALLARRPDPHVQAALSRVEGASIVVASTPVYRATYTGLLKVFFDLFPQRALAGKVALGIASGAAPPHRVVIDQGLRPLFESVEARVVDGVYATDADLADVTKRAAVLERIDRAVAETLRLAVESRA